MRKKHVLKFEQNHITSSNGNHIPTCMFDNKANIFSHMLAHLRHMGVLNQQDAWRF